MIRKNIKMRVLEGRNAAEWYAEEILSTPDIDVTQFRSSFLNYLCSKFLLKPSEITTDNFYEICQISVKKAAKMSPGALDAAETASKCGGATTAMNKKVLFIMAVKREFGINISPGESASVETFTALCDCVYNKIKKKNAGGKEED